MNLRKRLLLISTLVFGIVFTLSAIFIYIFFFKSSEQIIFKDLENSSLLTAYFYLEEDELPKKEHNLIRNEFKEKLSDSQVKLFNERDEFVYGEKNTGKEKYLTPKVLNRVRIQKKHWFKEGDTYFFGRFYPDNQGDFVVFVMTENEFFQSQIKHLISLLSGALIIGLILILLLSYYLSNIAYQPITKIVNQIDAVDIRSLDKKPQLIVPVTKDEVQRLTLKFNELFGEISDNFAIQKNFINYLSHEIKTPLASILGNLEVFGQKDRNPDEYRKVAKTSVENVHEIEDIINSLMILSGLENMNTQTDKFRIDEELWEILQKIYKKYPIAKSQITVEIKVKNPTLFELIANKAQIGIALYNIIENAVKYSNNKPIEVQFFDKLSKLRLQVKDYGKGIPKSELNYINRPFQRGSNVGNIKGSGIGLPLAILIFKQNKISFNIESAQGYGTEILLRF